MEFVNEKERQSVYQELSNINDEQPLMEKNEHLV